MISMSQSQIQDVDRFVAVRALHVRQPMKSKVWILNWDPVAGQSMKWMSDCDRLVAVWACRVRQTMESTARILA